MFRSHSPCLHKPTHAYRISRRARAARGAGRLNNHAVNHAVTEIVGLSGLELKALVTHQSSPRRTSGIALSPSVGSRAPSARGPRLRWEPRKLIIALVVAAVRGFTPATSALQIGTRGLLRHRPPSIADAPRRPRACRPGCTTAIRKRTSTAAYRHRLRRPTGGRGSARHPARLLKSRAVSSTGRSIGPFRTHPPCPCRACHRRCQGAGPGLKPLARLRRLEPWPLPTCV